MTQLSIELKQATKRFLTPVGKVYTAVRDINMVVSPGEFVAVVGPMGYGKSTTLGSHFWPGATQRRRSHRSGQADHRHQPLDWLRLSGRCGLSLEEKTYEFVEATDWPAQQPYHCGHPQCVQHEQ